MFDRMFVTTGQSSGHEKSQPYDGLTSNYSDSAHTVATPQQQYYQSLRAQMTSRWI